MIKKQSTVSRRTFLSSTALVGASGALGIEPLLAAAPESENQDGIATRYDFYGRKVHIWLQLPGFDRDKPDCGAAEYLERIGFIPAGLNALLFHSDIIHLHRGMGSEYELSPANCSYYASPRNTERDRQPWTNYNLRTLARQLKKAGTGLYAGIMGVMLNNAHHKEWIYDHREMMIEYHSGSGGIHPLKRFRDGTWYEDFFVEKLCEMLTDYEMEGVQMADGFCPSGQLHHNCDLSVDMFEQFLAHTGLQVPDFIQETLRDNTSEAKAVRRDWVWRYQREPWIRFYAWRWEQFFQKVCTRVHAIGKKVIVLGMYCTDPFETLYCLGQDLKSIVRAGVDYIMPNLLPTSVYMAWGAMEQPWPYRFHRYMAIAPLTAAYVPDGHFLSMLNVHDTTEEYDVLHHAPCKFERDLHTMTMYQLQGKKGLRPCMEGLMLCLGDGLSKYDWEWMAERLSIATSLQPTRALGPTLLWSDHEHDTMLGAYIQTKRWTTHKFVYEMFKHGVPCGTVLRSEHCAEAEILGPLFIPNIDLYSEEELRVIAASHHTIVCTAPVDFKPEQHGITPDHVWTDPHNSRYPLQVFVRGGRFEKPFLDHLDSLLEKDEASQGIDELEGDPDDYGEMFAYTLFDTLTFARLSKGFARQCAAVLKKLSEETSGFTGNVPMAIFETGRNKYRLYLYCKNEDQYDQALIRTTRKIKQVDIITKYPVLPARFREENHAFTVNTPPGGMTIVDVTFVDKF